MKGCIRKLFWKKSDSKEGAESEGSTERGSIALEYVLFIVAALALGVGVVALYQRMGDYLNGIDFDGGQNQQIQAPVVGG